VIFKNTVKYLAKSQFDLLKSLFSFPNDSFFVF